MFHTKDLKQGEIEAISNQFGVIDLLTAAIMRNHHLAYEMASDIANRLNSSDYLFDRLIDDLIEELVREEAKKQEECNEI